MATSRSYLLSFLPIAAMLLTMMAVSRAQVMESSMYDGKMPFQCSKVSFCRRTASETYISLSSILATFSSTTCQLSLDKGTLNSDLDNYFNKECVLKPNTADAFVVRSQTVIDLARESNCNAADTKLLNKLTVFYKCVVLGALTTTAKPLLSSTSAMSSTERQLTTPAIPATSVAPAALLSTTTEWLATVRVSTPAVALTSVLTTSEGAESTAAARLSTLASLTSSPRAPVTTGGQVVSVGVTAPGVAPSVPTTVGRAGSTAAATVPTTGRLTFNQSTVVTTREQLVTVGVTALRAESSTPRAVGSTAIALASNLSALVTTGEGLATVASGALSSAPLYRSVQTATWSFQTEVSQSANQTANVNMEKAKAEEWWSFFKTEPGVATIASTVFVMSIAIAGIAVLCSRRSRPKSSGSLAAGDHLTNGSAVKLANLTSTGDKTHRPSMQADRAMLSNQYEDVNAMRRQSTATNHAAASGGVPPSSSQSRGPLPLPPPPQQNGYRAVDGWRRPSYLDGGSAAPWPAPTTSQDDASNHYAPLVDASDMLRPLSERTSFEHRLSLGGVRRLSATFPSQAAHHGYAAMASIHEEDGSPAMRPLAVGAMPSPLPTARGGVGADPARRPSQFLPRTSRSGISGLPDGSAVGEGGSTFPVVLNRRFSEMSINTPM